MSKENEFEKGWTISIGLYPGELLGVRSYYNNDVDSHVLYLPFIDIAFQVFK